MHVRSEYRGLAQGGRLDGVLPAWRREAFADEDDACGLIKVHQLAGGVDQQALDGAGRALGGGLNVRPVKQLEARLGELPAEVFGPFKMAVREDQKQLGKLDAQPEKLRHQNFLLPIVGAAGTALTPMPGYYQQFRKICDDHNILFIADEVMTGLGRTGKWFAMEHWTTNADIVAVGKSLGAGYAPIAATLMTDKILNVSGVGVISSNLLMSLLSFFGKFTISEYSIIITLCLTILFYIYKIRNEIKTSKKIDIEVKKLNKKSGYTTRR